MFVLFSMRSVATQWMHPVSGHLRNDELVEILQNTLDISHPRKEEWLSCSNEGPVVTQEVNSFILTDASQQ